MPTELELPLCTVSVVPSAAKVALTVWVPMVPVGVYVVAQVKLYGGPALQDDVHVVGEKVPAPPVTLQVTVPPGALCVPPLDALSETVTLHATDPFKGAVAGGAGRPLLVQLTTLVVARRVTVIEKPLLVLASCASPTAGV
jgi:hypothetical protein